MDFPAAMPAPERLQAMLAAMARLDKPCLLIIDNANDVRELEKHYLALRSCPNFHILLTTRITTFGQAETYRIEPLKEADALALFKRHYPKHQDDEDDLLKSIRTAVGGNTLVMELLAKNLAAINADEIFYSLADLLHDLQKRGLLQLSQTGIVTIAEKGRHPALKKANPTDIIAALYDEMEMVVPLTEAEQRLLCNLAVLPAENVAYDLLKTLLAPPDAKAFSGTLTDLAQRGWLEKSLQKNASCYKISPVVQEITRHKNKENLPAYCETLINTLIEKLAYQPGIGHFLNASYQEAALYSRYAVAVKTCCQETDYKLSLLCDRIGNYHQTTGNLDQALMFYKEYHRLAKELLDAYPDNADFKNSWAIACERVGTTHTALGHLDQALGFYKQSHCLANELYDAYPDNVRFKNGLAVSFIKLGWFFEEVENKAKASEYYRQSQVLLEQLVGGSPLNVKFKSNLDWVVDRLAGK